MITKLIDNTTEIFDRNFLELDIDEINLESLKNDSFRNALFYESLKRETVDKSCYLYLLITSNFFSKFNFLDYKNTKSLEALLKEYLNFKLKDYQNKPGTINALDKLLLQIASPKFNHSMEIDHIFPSNGLKISNHIDKLLNLNHIGNLCYLSKRNNQIKSNKLPLDYLEYLVNKDESKLILEFLNQTYWNQLISKGFNGEINNKAAFDSYLLIRSQQLIECLVLKVSGLNNNVITSHDNN